jgi:hypothetical protein
MTKSNANTVKNAVVNANVADANAAEQKATVNVVTARINRVTILEKDEERPYTSISLGLSSPLNVMIEGNDGTWAEETRNSLIIPMAAFLACDNDAIISYYIARNGATEDILKDCYSAATVKIRQQYLAAGETIKDLTNASDHDQWFSIIEELNVLTPVVYPLIAASLKIPVEALAAFKSL